ncbi:MAG: type IV secretion protein Rhs, partial [Parachlamydia sp.]
SKLSGGYNVHAVYNATHEIAVDLNECHMGLNNIATEPVRQLHKMWNSFFERSAANAQFLMICHSQGVIHVMNSLLDYPPELRERIIIVAIAPGGYIYEECCARVTHVRVKKHRDLVPRFDQKGAQRAKGTIIEDSHPNASFFDHSFTSPTYRRELINSIRSYIAIQGQEI